MSRLLLFHLFVILFITSTACAFQSTGQNQQDNFERISPEDAGFSSDSLKVLRDYLETSGSSSVILAYDGKIFFEWGDIYKKHTIHSIRKSMLNSLYGISVEKGLIDTSATIRELNIDDIDSLTETEKSARVADLLKSRSGIYHDAAAVSPGMHAGQPERGTHKPNEAYFYNNWDFNTLGAIFEQQTGQTIYDAFYQEIAQQIGMKQFKGEYNSIDISNEKEEELGFPTGDGFYQYESDRSKYPAYHFRMSAHDMALYGTLYLNDGMWEDHQIIPADWVQASTKSYSVTNEYMDFGYGMLWFIINQNENRTSSSFYHTGAGIHMLGVYPASKIVFIHRVDTESNIHFPQERLYEIISLVWGAQL